MDSKCSSCDNDAEYSMMKEIFVCTVGTKLKKHHKRNAKYSLTEFRIENV
jgi:hypothetical protein